MEGQQDANFVKWRSTQKFKADLHVYFGVDIQGQVPIH